VPPLTATAMFGDHFDALADQAVDDAADGLFVARNGARGKDHPVALAEGDVGMLVEGYAGQGGAGLAPTAGSRNSDASRSPNFLRPASSALMSPLARPRWRLFSHTHYLYCQVARSGT